MYTADEINAMTPNELKAAQKEMGKIMAKRIALQLAITTTLIVATNIVVKKLESKTEQTED